MSATPATRALDRAGIPYRLLTYQAGSSQPTGLAAAAALKLPVEQVFKTLVAVLSDGAFVVAIVPVARELDLKRLARAAGVKSARMADPQSAERTTGYVTGGISPIGQRKSLRTYLASEGMALETIHVSAGKRGLELALDPTDLQRATGAEVCTLTG